MSSGTATSTVGTSSTSCELWDLVLTEFQQLLGRGEVIAEAEDGSGRLREFVLLVEWSRPLHVVIVVDSARQEERLAHCVRARPACVDGRLPAEAMMRCAVCGNGERRPTRRPYVEERGHRVAVVTGVPVEECPACGEIWLAEPVALRLDALLTQMLATETVAVRPFLEVEPTAA
jgi:YgiT-type zinc finger domain-containing protein